MSVASAGSVIKANGKLTLFCDLQESKKSIQTAIKFFEYLESDAFARANARRFERASVAVVKEEAVAIVDRVVYGYEPQTPEPYYVRTYKLRRSIKVVTGENAGGGDDNTDLGGQGNSKEEGIITIYSDPLVSPGKEGYGSEDLSYAAFFIKPVEFHTFLRPRGRKSANTYRNFFVEWESFMRDYGPLKALDAIETTIEAHVPPSMR